MEKPGYIKISKDEAIKMQWELIKNWKPRLDVWPFSYGIGTLSALCVGSGAVINTSIRKALSLKHHLRYSSYIPVTALPGFFAGVCHFYLVSSDILIQETKCFPCLQTRAVAYQLAIGLGYPLVLAPVMSMITARTFYTYDAPPPSQVTKFVKFWFQLTTKIQKKISIFAVMHTAAAMFIIYQQVNSLSIIESKLDKMSEENTVKSE